MLDVTSPAGPELDYRYVGTLKQLLNIFDLTPKDAERTGTSS
jgi:hypothetical protein